MPVLRLTKHHALGNDFLVLLDAAGAQPVDAALARRLCDRHRGVGADGLIRVHPGRPGADVAMELYNADGGSAEMSGNGIRCLAQAVVVSGMVPGPAVAVATAAGLRRAVVRVGPLPSVADVAAEMGLAKAGPQVEGPLGRPARPVDMGNPHLVVLVTDPAAVDVARVGPEVEAGFAAGINVEFVAPVPGGDELTMRVWERGVGETLACGTGACAAAAACQEWDLVATPVVVHQPGGDAHVDLRPDTAVLSGPVTLVARVEVEV